MAECDPEPEGELVASIDDTCTGTWIITTESGTRYLLDLDQRHLVRQPREGEHPATDLRGDHQPLHLHSVTECSVGKIGLFHIQVRDDAISTLRMTTAVIAIARG